MLNKNIIIDFDSTFVTVEALDELAKIALNNSSHHQQIVEQIINITQQGMEGKISLKESLNSRLKLFQANKQHVEILIDKLKQQVSPSMKRNINFFKQFAANIYIVSSGFKQYIQPVVDEFAIEPDHVFANSFIYDEQDNICGLDLTNTLSGDQGKVQIVKNLKLSGETIVIGDGYTDYEIKKFGAADYFYAYTENVRRESVLEHADFIVPNFDEFLFLNNLPMTISYPKNRIKILLLEDVHAQAFTTLQNEGYSVEKYTGSMDEDELCEKIKDVSVLGIRSKTNLSAKVLAQANKLLCVGAFCIGTNQIDIQTATQKGIAVFNAPYSNTRSVVELVIGEIIFLMRNIISKNNLLHQGKWNKSSKKCFEIRGKKLGIVGYGNIGSQLSVLAESLGMQVYYYDLIERLQLGNAKKCDSLEQLLQEVDIVTLHVDGRKQNNNLIGAKEFDLMKQDALFINLSRGHVVDIDALADNITKGKILGCAVDVFPYEPINNQEEFVNKLRNLPNTILTPHVGGSTEEAQLNIGNFVAHRIINYINHGDTTQSVNLPNLQLPGLNNAHRLVHLHKNKPGVLAEINNALAQNGINVVGQYLKTNEEIGYVITDVASNYDQELVKKFKKFDFTIKTRILY
jgi:D-3-phosphoglycerate dehydrogenase